MMTCLATVLWFQRQQLALIIVRKIVRITTITIVISVHAGALVIAVYIAVLVCPMATTSHVPVVMALRRTSAAAAGNSTRDRVQPTSSGTMSSRSATTPVRRAKNVWVCDHSVPILKLSLKNRNNKCCPLDAVADPEVHISEGEALTNLPLNPYLLLFL